MAESKLILGEAPECVNCGQLSSEDVLTLIKCGSVYLCDACYEEEKKEEIDEISNNSY